MRRAPVVLTVAALVAGGSDRLSRDEYVRRASAICRQANRQVAALPRPQTGPALLAMTPRGRAARRELRAYERRIDAVGRRALARLRALRPSARVRPAHERLLREIVAAGRVALPLRRQSERVAAAMRRGDEAAVEADSRRFTALVRRLQAHLRRADAAARAAGVPACARS